MFFFAVEKDIYLQYFPHNKAMSDEENDDKFPKENNDRGNQERQWRTQMSRLLIWLPAKVIVMTVMGKATRKVARMKATSAVKVINDC